MKVALVTGTSTGIGLSAAVKLAASGWRVVATMRDPAKATALVAAAEAAGVVDAIDVRPLDVSIPASVTACIEGVLAEHGRVDVVVNNAGAGFLGSMEQTSDADLRATMEVNFFGVWAVTQGLLPHMRKAGAGRIVTVTSVGGVLGQPFNDAYCAAKFAVEGAMESLAPVVKRMGIDVVLVEPGAVRTEFVANVLQKGTPAALPTDESDAYGRLLAAYREGTNAAYASGQTPDQVADVIVEACTADSPHFRYQTSDFIKMIVGKKFVDPTGDSGIQLSGARLPTL